MKNKYQEFSGFFYRKVFLGSKKNCSILHKNYFLTVILCYRIDILMYFFTEPILLYADADTFKISRKTVCR